MEINIGIIGISRGEKLIRLIKKTDLKLNIISVLDTDKKKLNFFKKKNPSIKIFSSQNKFFTDDKINAVYIASPVRNHFNHTIEAAKNKKHILCEVPAFKKIKEGAPEVWEASLKTAHRTDAEKINEPPLAIPVSTIRSGFIFQINSCNPIIS